MATSKCPAARIRAHSAGLRLACKDSTSEALRSTMGTRRSTFATTQVSRGNRRAACEAAAVEMSMPTPSICDWAASWPRPSPAPAPNSTTRLPGARVETKRHFHERVEDRAADARGQKPRASLDRLLRVPGGWGSSVLGLQEVDVAVARHVVRVPGAAGPRALAAIQRQPAPSDRARRQPLQPPKAIVVRYDRRAPACGASAVSQCPTMPRTQVC